MGNDTSMDIAEIEADNIFQALLKNNDQLYRGLRDAVYSILNGVITDEKFIVHKQRTLSKLEEVVGFYTLNNPSSNGQPNPYWLGLSNEISELLARLNARM